jgi:hypothetical protein
LKDLNSAMLSLRMTTMVEIIATRCIWLWTSTNSSFSEIFKFISLCQQLLWKHPPICKSENQLYWCISILSVMDKYEMWGHLHPSLHKLQTESIATYCYQQRLFKILRFINREQPCTMETYRWLCTQINDNYVQQQLGDIC